MPRHRTYLTREQLERHAAKMLRENAALIRKRESGKRAWERRRESSTSVNFMLSTDCRGGD
jgi:hypothetical protein